MSGVIKQLQALEIIDSRGNPTLSVRCVLADNTVGEASVPSGASTGEFEALELRDGDSTRYRGKGVQLAVGNVEQLIAPALAGKSAFNQSAIDQVLLELDGTPNKEKLGANAILGVSLAVAHAAAIAQGQPLFRYLGNTAAVQLPCPMVNVINGGEHADNSLDIQEFMIVPHGAGSLAEAVRISAEIFHRLGTLLRDDGYSTGVGDEGGYAPRLESMELAFDFLIASIEKAGFRPGEEVSLALDVAASELIDESKGKIEYHFERSDLGRLTSSELISKYEEWCGRYPIVSIEDGLSENDWNGWQEMTTRLGSKIQLVGDDLFVTNVERLNLGIEKGVANSILIKLNQIGTLSETLVTMQRANEANYTNVVSHRSGETSDTTIADLAVATNAGQIKTGSMCRGERVAKYNRLLWIERELGSQAQYVDIFKARV